MRSASSAGQPRSTSFGHGVEVVRGVGGDRACELARGRPASIEALQRAARDDGAWRRVVR